ncbi:MAG: mismatch-specific DNA-glycosylase [Firmicutes bacterium]|nr:mismatch-specific DNA-glycosylase [Bacillota bacterium]
MLTEKLRHDLRILFIGFNPSLRSFARGYNFAGRANRFYRVLHLCGLTKRLYQPEESFSLLDDYGFGFTNIVARPTLRADELSRDEYRAGAVILRAKLEHYRPRIACFVGKGVYVAFAGAKSAGAHWGFAASSQVAGVRDFVGPSTSGLVRMTLAEQVSIYQALADAVADG